MKKLITVFFILSIFALNISAQTPKWTTYDYNSSNSALTATYCLATDASGNIWIGTNQSVVKFNQGSTWTVYDYTTSGMVNDRVMDITVTNTNSLWVCTYGSGFLYYNGVSLWVQKNMSTTGNLMPTNWTYCLTLDNTSNIYVGIYCGNNSNAGLVKWDGANIWTPFNNFFNGYNYSNVEVIAKDIAGNIWCGTNIGVYKFNPTNSSWTAYTKENTSGGLGGNWVRVIAPDASGNIWFGTMDKVNDSWVGAGLTKYTPSTNLWSNYIANSQDASSKVVSAIAHRGNDVWVGTGFCGQYNGNGLYKFSGSSWTNYAYDNNTFPGNCVNDLVVDKNNNLWIAGANILTKVDFNPTDVKETESIPTSFKLNQNYPNPFNPETVISYQLPISGKVHLSVSDLLGREVAVLVDETQPAGNHQITFSTARTTLSSGVYFYKLQMENFVDVKKMMIIK
ncbi:MAG: T9SS type A sorting domain-containing protein [Ignavibacteriales bacterium]|nr:T9SS type A sorting domain-containing protein [Ignavibacteriales bacterium]